MFFIINLTTCNLLPAQSLTLRAMAILTYLHNDILLSITAEVNPSNIDLFVPSCKRKHKTWSRSRFETSKPTGLFGSVLQDPDLALYPIVWSSRIGHDWKVSAPEALITEINNQIPQNPHTDLLKTKDSKHHTRNLVALLLTTRLFNPRKISICVYWQRQMLEPVSRIVDADHEFGSETRIALGTK